jgi:DNA-directed RNA polymerase subunit H (RpoH/RPB5)
MKNVKYIYHPITIPTMSVYKYQPLVVYQNLRKLLEYRKIKSSYTFVGGPEFTRSILADEYIVINGVQERPNGLKSKQIAIVLIGPGSDYANTLAKFRKMFNAVYTDGLDIMLLITEAGVSTYIKKTLMGEFTKNRSNFIIRDYSYAMFTLVVPEHVQVPEHTFATNEEVADQSHGSISSLRRLQKILDSDPMAVWMGAEPGDLIRITRPSESAGMALVYRYCIRGS